ncbi:rCG48819 [Rattus norvegicus]|uniref:RCG48819 n=1 Tax=Rattus norvegicus TaxID=10116 RepID=A6IFQ9_RAT|nr:rCG48819 [Rattus norvegicus]
MRHSFSGLSMYRSIHTCLHTCACAHTHIYACTAHILTHIKN